LWKGHLIGKDGALVVAAVLVGVFEHEDAVWRIRFKLRLVPVHADGITDEEAPLVIKAAHDGMGDERGGSGDFELVAVRKIVLRQRERRLAGDDAGAFTTFGDGAAFIWREICGENGDGKEEKQLAHDGSHT
jgi:hypothetical protein